MNQYDKLRKVFSVVAGTEPACTKANAVTGAGTVPVQDTHQWRSDAPTDFEVCACGEFYFAGAQLDSGTPVEEVFASPDAPVGE